MKYRITITKLVENPKYAEENAEYKESTRWGQGGFKGAPERTRAVDALVSYIDESQFAAVRKALVESL